MQPLVVGVDNAVGLSLIQCFDEEATVHAADYQNVAQGLYHKNTTPHVISENDVGANVAAIVEETGVNLILPSRLEDLPALAANRQRIASAGGHLAVPDTETVEQLTDKQWIISSFSDTTPETVSAEETDSLPFPVVVRRRYTPIEGEPTPLKDAERLAYETRSVRRDGDTPLVQRYVEGDATREFLVGQIYDDSGTLVEDCAIQILSKQWRYWGKTEAAETTENSDLLATARKVGQRIDVSGCPLRLLFKKRPDGGFALLDIDPLFWEPLRLTAEAGVNGPAVLANTVMDSPTDQSADTGGVRSVRNNHYISVNKEDVLEPRGE